jgi:hypothetical protein
MPMVNIDAMEPISAIANAQFINLINIRMK